MTKHADYWDLDEVDRATLTTEQVNAFTAAELMRLGVLRVAPLVLEPEPAAPEPTDTVYRVKGGKYGGKLDVAFQDIETANAFILLSAVVVDHEYIGGQTVYSYLPVASSEITAEKVFSAASLAVCKANLTKANEIKEANRKATEAHDKAIREEQAALTSMWSDWRACRAKAASFARLLETYVSYIATAGDEVIAVKFLLKVFTREQIAEASAWLKTPIALPVADAEFAEVGEAPKANGTEAAAAVDF